MPRYEIDRTPPLTGKLADHARSARKLWSCLQERRRIIRGAGECTVDCPRLLSYGPMPVETLWCLRVCPY
ncbi:hypothetical protein EVAR_35455_1 [Eumeta japonica]|uniref:Uncharacterized protein n=1 Tax=Eumeta variegata TaxID=151549 RepID=A0A4C1XNI4_EUMVA|nr:hypothetical protein EVAR_35455_1 [Eumeta japonica]